MLQELSVSLGSKGYRVERPWGAWPVGLARGLVSDVAVDKSDNVYVCQRFDSAAGHNGPVIVVFDSGGQFLRHWGEGMISDAHMMRLTGDGNLMVVDRDAHQILTFDLDGKCLDRLGKRNTPGAPFNHPTDIAIAANGDLYVSDGYGGSQVHWFSPDGSLRKSWGTPGRGVGQFSVPHGIAVLPDSRIAVVDRENHRVQLFSPEGEYLDAWTDFTRPLDIWVDAAGSILVSDSVPRLSRYDGDGNLTGRCRPVLNGGHGLCTDGSGNIYIAEPNPSRVTRLRCL